MLPISMPLGVGSAGAIPAASSWEILLNTQPFYTKGWATIEIEQPNRWSSLMVEVALPPSLPASAHLHVVITPMIQEGRNVSEPERDPDHPAFPYWPWGSGEEPQPHLETMTRDWMGHFSHAFVAFRDQVYPLNSGEAYQDLVPPMGLKPAENSSFPIDRGPGVKPFIVVGRYGGEYFPWWHWSKKLIAKGGERGAQSRLWCAEPSHPALVGREVLPGGVIRVALPPSSSTAKTWRVAIALYHQGPDGQDSAFYLDQSEGLAPAATLNYPNDPFFLGRPWGTPSISQNPAWLSNWRYLDPDQTPWSTLSSPLPTRVFNGWPEQDDPPRAGVTFGTYLPTEGAFMPWTMHDTPSLLPWTSLIGEESARWVMAWASNICELEKWVPYQRATTTFGRLELQAEQPEDQVNHIPYMPEIWTSEGRRAMLPSQCFLAQWGHLAWSFLFQYAPYFSPLTEQFPSPEAFPKRWVLPVYQFSPAWSNPYTGIGGGGKVGSVVTSSDDPLVGEYRSHHTAKSWLDQWPKVFETQQEALWTGTSFARPLDAEGSPFLWQPTLPPLFGQWEVLSSPEWMMMVLQSHGQWWEFVRQIVLLAWGPDPEGTSLISYNSIANGKSLISANWETEFGDWWEWMQTQPSSLKWPDPPSNEVWPVRDLGANWIALGGPYIGNGWIDYVDGGSFKGMAPWMIPMEPMIQPIFTIQTGSYAIRRVRVYGRKP